MFINFLNLMAQKPELKAAKKVKCVDPYNNSEQKSYLLDGTLSLEEDPSTQQLCKDAAHRPNINGVGVVATPHQDLWCSVVLCHHFLSHVPGLISLLHPGQAKVTDLQRNHTDDFQERHLTASFWSSS